MRILVFLLFSFAASAQIPLYQLEYAPDSMKVIGAAADGEPIWVNRSSAAKVKNSPTMTLRIQNDSIRADIKKRLNAINVGGADVFLSLQIDSTGQIYGVNEIISDDFDKDPYNEFQSISIDSLNRVFTITLTDGGVVKFLDRGITTNDSIYFSQDTIFLRDGSGFAALPCDKFIEIDRTKTGDDFDYPSDQVPCGTVGYTFYTNISSYDCIAWHYTLDGINWSMLFEDCDLYSDNEGDLFLTSGGSNDVHLRSNTNFLKYILIQGLSGIKITEDASSGIINFGVDSVWIGNIISDSLATIPRDTVTLTDSGNVTVTGTYPDFNIHGTPDEIIRTGNTITLRDGDGSVDLSDLVNAADSTVIVDGWGITSVESPANTFNLIADSSQVATQYDLSLKQDKLSGTNNRLSKWSNGSSTLVNSQISDDGTNIVIGQSQGSVSIDLSTAGVNGIDIKRGTNVHTSINSDVSNNTYNGTLIGHNVNRLNEHINTSLYGYEMDLGGRGNYNSGGIFFSQFLPSTSTYQRLFSVKNTGVFRINNLAGSGTRMVTTTADGDLGSAAIPTGTVTSITASAPLTGGTITSTGSIGADTTSTTGLGTQYDLSLKQDKLTGANKRIPYFTGTSTLSSSDNLSYDDKKLGIGTVSPQATLDLSSTGGNSIRFYDSAAGTNYKEWKIQIGNDGREMNFISRSDLGSEYNFMTFNRATNSQIMANWYAPFISSTTGTGDNVMTINEVGSIYRSPLKTINSASLFGTGDISLFTLPSLTAGSVLFSNGTTIAQDNGAFFWNNSNKRLGIGTNSPSESIHSTSNIRTNADFILNAKYKLSTTGNDFFIQPQSVNGFIHYKDLSFENVLSFDLANRRLGLLNSSPSYKFDLASAGATDIMRILTDTKTLMTIQPTETTYNSTGFTVNATGRTNALRVDNSTGNIGLGISPTVKLDVEGLTPVLRLSDTNQDITWDETIGELRFFSKEADGNRISGFLRNAGDEEYGRRSYLSFGTSVTNNAAATEQMRLHTTLRVNALAGSGTRMVTANASGDLSTQTIPVNTDAQTLSFGTKSGANVPFSITGGNTVNFTDGVGTSLVSAGTPATLSVDLVGTANSVKARVGTGSGTLSDVALSASQLVGRGSGNVQAVSLGTGLTFNASNNLAFNQAWDGLTNNALSVNQSLSTTDTKVDFNSINTGEFSANSTTDQLLLPANGTYEITYNGDFTMGSSNTLYFTLYAGTTSTNGTSIGLSYTGQAPPTGSNGFFSKTVMMSTSSSPVYVDLRYKRISGSSTTIDFISHNLIAKRIR